MKQRCFITEMPAGVKREYIYWERTIRLFIEVEIWFQWIELICLQSTREIELFRAGEPREGVD